MFSLTVSHTKVSKVHFYKCALFFLSLSLFTFFIHHFHSYKKILTLIPLIPTLIPCISTPIPRIPTLILRISTLIPLIPTLISHIPIISNLILRIPTLILVFTDSLEISGEVCIVIVCYPFFDVKSFKFYLSFLIPPFSYLIKNSEQKLKYLKNKKSFYGEVKISFHHF